MCLQDWRLGLVMRSVITPFTVTSAAVIPIAANRQRAGIYVEFNAVTSSGGLSADLNCEGGPIARYTGFQPSRIFTLENSGDLVTRAMNISSNVAGSSVGVIVEWFLPAEYLATELDKFRKG